MVDLLMEWRPALADQVDSSGSSPLHFASSSGHRTIVLAILRAAPPTSVYKKDTDGLSALHVAARMGHHRVVEDMLRSFPDAAKLWDAGGATFVHTAARETRSKVVSLAIKNPMLRGLLDAQDRDGNTPLHLAVTAGAPDVVESLLRKAKVRTDVLNNDGRTPFDLAAGSTSFFTMLKLVVTLVAFGAQLRPQRPDHLKPWSERNTVEKIEKTTDSLAVVAVLIATEAFTARFNMPGQYGDTGEANLMDKPAFKGFLFLDIVAVATSMAAGILLVYGKASRSVGLWKSFVWALQCMWVSLISLMLAFYAALVATVTTGAVDYGFIVILLCIYGLQLRITTWIGPAPMSRTIWRFFLQRIGSKRRHAIIKRQYPLAGASVLNYYLFTVICFLASVAFGAFFESYRRLDVSPAPSPL